MAPSPDHSLPPDFADRVDGALEALWRGDTAPFERVLGSYNSAAPHIGELVDGVIREHAGPVVDLPITFAVPGYEILGDLGRGGMGLVYKARQRSTDRVVALKVVRSGAWADEHHLRLFRRETRALGRLKHPCVGAIYDAGRTHDGQPFFAMELVDGLPVTAYARIKELSIRERLELFCKVCGAVNYAHQRGVIHRDLKPSNILIDADGNPKILDFGVARITEMDVSATTVVTVAGNLIGTLPYMSPEQARGKPDEIDLRSDVYSLGVIVYELVTERLPYEVNGAALPEAVRIICEEVPRRPGMISRVSGNDLETIVSKALEKEPSRRYQSALALSEDIERYLGNQPILARPPSAVYQFRKLVARHKLPAAFAAALFVVLFIFSTGLGLLLARAWRAEAELRRKAESLIQALKHVDDARHASQGVTEILRGAVAKGEKLDAQVEWAAARYADQPQVVAALYEMVGKAYLSLDRYDDAEPYLRGAKDMREPFVNEEPERFTAAQRDLALLLQCKREFEEAESLYYNALEVARHQWGDEHPEIARTLTDIAGLRYAEGNHEAAVAAYHQALDAWRSLPGDHDKEMADTLWPLATLHHTIGEYTVAESYYHEVLEIRRRHGDALAEAGVMTTLGNLLRLKGDLAGAEEQHRGALEIRRRQLGDEPMGVGCSVLNLASLLYEKGDYAESEAFYREALDIYRNSMGTEHRRVGLVLVGLGYVLTEKGDPEAGEPYLRQGLAVWQKSPPEEDWLIAEADTKLGQCLTALGRYDEAEPLVVRGYSAIKDALGEQHRRTTSALRRVITLYESWDKPERLAPYRAGSP